MKEEIEYFIDDTPLNYSVYENLSDEEFSKVVAEMEKRHNEIIMERIKIKEEIEYLVDDTPVDISHYSDEEIERLFQERFGEYEKGERKKARNKHLAFK